MRPQRACTRSRRHRSPSAGDIDWPSVDSLVEFYLQCGVQGLTVLGMMGEAQKLSDQESAELTRHLLRRVNGRVPVIVGVSNPGTANLVKLSRIAMDAGACGVMVAPLDRPQDGSADRQLFCRRDRGAGRENSGRLPGLPAVDAGRHLGPELPQDRRHASERGDVQARGLPGPQEAHADTQGLRWQRASLHQHPGRQWRPLRAAGIGARRRRHHDRLRLPRDAGLGVRAVCGRAQRRGGGSVRRLPAAGAP